jgi:hypothetical protein
VREERTMTGERSAEIEDLEELEGRRAHHPCPACGAHVTVPEREDVLYGFICPSCRVHLSEREGHLHLVWNHREAVDGSIGGKIR